MPKIVDTRYTQDRELSWLRFNERVLEEAKDESVPLMERLKFAAIFTSNLDEFFMIRVGSLCDLTLVKEPHFDARTGQTPDQQLSAIYQAVTPLYKMRDKVVDQLEKRLRTCNICRMTMDEMDTKERKQVENWFRDELQPILSPQVVDSRHPFPHLSNQVLNIVLRLQSDDQEALGLIPIPQSLPPYFVLRERGVRYILTEDVLLEYAKKLFPTFSVQGKAVCSVTRNADISPEDEAYDVDEDYRQHMRKIVKKRNRLAPVRLEIQSSTRDEKAIEFLCSKLKLTREQVFFSKCPLRMNYVFSLEGLLPPESKSALCYPPYTPRFPACLRPDEKILPQILRHDALLFYPFESMDPFLHLVREASSDPNVISIKITIYRLASKAKLAQASQAGVEVVMNVRGICCIRPGIPGLTDHITIFSIVGRYLEHTRIYRFGRGDNADLFISSADFMTRNTERRVEVACPVLDPQVRRSIFHICDVLVSDNVKARQLGPDGQWSPRKTGAAPCSSQDVFLEEGMGTTYQEPAARPAKRKKGLLSRLFKK